jgi:class 3 adenylate cyclase/predicted ATPase
MSVLDVRAWLESEGFGRFAAAFEENEVDGAALLELHDEHLKELGIPLGPRVKLLRAIEDLRTGASETTDHGVAAPAEPAEPTPRSDAERRHLTVMFIDLVGSTALSTRLDPEDMGDVIRRFQDVAAGVITRFDGHVAKYMGDGILAYFGWPRAHEDDAERAVRTGLEVADAVEQLAAPDGSRLSVRVGIASGLAVVGELVGDEEARERAVVGETPNLAARVQGVAESGQVVIAESTRRLLGRRFELVDLGERELKGLATPVRVFTVGGERALDSRFEARSADVLPMVGRDQELALVLERWGMAEQGEGQGVLLIGEAGIGKSRIVRALMDELADRPHTRIRYNCSPYYADSALWPVVQQLTRAAGIAREDATGEKLEKLESLLVPADDAPNTPALLANLLGLEAEHRYGRLDMGPQEVRARTLQALVAQLAAVADRQPVLMTLEDAHWVDPTTLELIEHSLDRIGDTRVLMVLTSRPDNQPELAAHPHVTRLTLNRLGRSGVEAIVDELSPEKKLPADVVDAIIARTDGVPLFVEEVTKAALETGETTVPASLHDSLMARLDRIPDVKEVAQIASCIGREFDYPLLAEIIDLPQSVLDEALDRLAGTALIFRRGRPPDATYTFKHALVQDTAYASLLRSRRRQTHNRIARALEGGDDEHGSVAPELIARHLTEAAEIERAVPYWRRAGSDAVRRSADVEAIGHLSQALELVEQLPRTPERLRDELELVTMLAGPTISTKGYGSRETTQVYVRAHELAEKVDDPSLFFPTLYGRWVYALIHGDHHRAAELASDFLRLAGDRPDAGLTLTGHRMLGLSLFETRPSAEAKAQFEHALRLYDPDEHATLLFQFGQDPYSAALSFTGFIDLELGFPERATTSIKAAVARAEDVGHPNSKGYVMTFGSLQVAWGMRDVAATRRTAEALIALCEEYGMPMWLAYAKVFRGWAMTMADGSRDGIAGLREGLNDLETTDTLFHRAQVLGMLGEALGRCGARQDAMETIDQAVRFAGAHGEAWVEPELLRIRGELLLAESDHEGVGSLERSAILADERGAPWWRLRAALPLAELALENGKPVQAQQLLAPVYESFSEGFDTVDLVRAARLMERVDVEITD